MCLTLVTWLSILNLAYYFFTHFRLVKWNSLQVLPLPCVFHVMPASIQPPSSTWWTMFITMWLTLPLYHCPCHGAPPSSIHQVTWHLYISSLGLIFMKWMVIFIASHGLHRSSTLALLALLGCLDPSASIPLLTFHSLNGSSCPEPLAYPSHLHMFLHS
jgi:hypothetical protein